MCLWPAGSRGSLRAAEEQSSDFILRDFILIKCIVSDGMDRPAAAMAPLARRGRCSSAAASMCSATSAMNAARKPMAKRASIAPICCCVKCPSPSANGYHQMHGAGQGRARCRSTFVHVSEHAHHQLLLVVALRQQRIAEQIRHRVPIPRDMRLLGPGGACCRGMSVRRLL